MPDLECIQEGKSDDNSFLVTHQDTLVRTEEKDMNEQMDRAYPECQLMMPSRVVENKERAEVMPTAEISPQSNKALAFNMKLNKFLKIPFRHIYQSLDL